MKIRIRENSRLAKIAARRLRSAQVAIVFNKTIHLWGANKIEFLQNLSWVRHEVAHVQQYKRYGVVRFVVMYLYQTLLKGYYNNRFEAEARDKENDAEILEGVAFL